MNDPKSSGEPIPLRATTYYIAVNDPFEAAIAKEWLHAKLGESYKGKKTVETRIDRLLPECHVITLVRRSFRSPISTRWKNPANDSFEVRQTPPKELIGEITPSEPIPMAKFYRDVKLDAFGDTERELDRAEFLKELGIKSAPAVLNWNPDSRPGIFSIGWS